MDAHMQNSGTTRQEDTRHCNEARSPLRQYQACDSKKSEVDGRRR